MWSPPPPIYLQICMSGGKTAAGIVQNFFCSYLVTFRKHWKTNLRMADGRHGNRRVNIYLPENKRSLCSDGVGVQALAFLMFETQPRAEPEKSAVLTSALHSCLSPRFVFAVTPVPCSSSLTWRFVRGGDVARLKTSADGNPETNQRQQQTSPSRLQRLSGRSLLRVPPFT